MRPLPGRSALAASAPVIFLFVCLALIVMLAWQALAAHSGHRALAQRVLRDYGDLAAMELIRRGSTFLFTYGVDVAAQALARAQGSSDGPLPSREAIGAQFPTPSKRAIELIGDVLRVDTAGRNVESSGEALPERFRSRLLTLLTAPPPVSAPARVVTLTEDGQTRIFAFANGGLRAEDDPIHLGFDVRLDAVAAWLREFGLSQPLLPPALASREVAESSLTVDVRLEDGRSLLHPSEPQLRGNFVASRDWSDEASRRALLGVKVVSYIDESAASSLIIGGMPQTRFGVLVSLFVVTTALAVVAVLQLRRDRDLAALRQDFVTRASHELRTPVARIRIFADTLLLDRVRTDQERREAVLAIDRAARRLSLLVENVLQFSRMDSGDVPLHVERTDLAAFVRDIVDEFETTIGGARVTVSGPPSSADASVDREGLRQALLNLLDNAWKYGGATRPIGVDVSVVGDQIQVRVTDAGPGVPERERERIWEPYVRLDRDRRSSVAGTGIGLAVVRDIVRRHQGSSWVETADGGGATFVLALPAPHAVGEPSSGMDPRNHKRPFRRNGRETAPRALGRW